MKQTLRKARAKLRDPLFREIVVLWVFLGFSVAMIVMTW